MPSYSYIFSSRRPTTQEGKEEGREARDLGRGEKGSAFDPSITAKGKSPTHQKKKKNTPPPPPPQKEAPLKRRKEWAPSHLFLS